MQAFGDVFSSVMEEFKDFVGHGFWLTVFFPIFVFVAASLALYLEITQGLGTSLAQWEKLSVLTQTLSVLMAIVILLAIAFGVYNLQYALTRLFEGYGWESLPILNLIRNRRIELYKRRWDYLKALTESVSEIAAKSRISAEQLAYYPPPTHLELMMPTRLGNILRAAEIYPYDRYGIDATVLWPRLSATLDANVISGVEVKRGAMNFMLLLTVLAALFTLVWCPVLALTTNRWDLFLLCAVGLPIAWVCYRNAAESAIAYGEQVKTTFDLHRLNLIKALGRPIPSSATDERKEWLRLTRFFYRNVPLPPLPVAPAQPKNWDRVGDALADYLEKLEINKRDKGTQP